MQQPPSPPMSRLTCLGLAILTVLAFVFVGLLTLGVFSHHLPLKVVQIIELAQFAVLGTGFLFGGLKTWRLRLAKGQKEAWYTQPMLLFALAELLIIPGFVINYTTSFDLPNGLLFSILLIAPSILLILAAVFFGIRRLVNS